MKINGWARFVIAASLLVATGCASGVASTNDANEVTEKASTTSAPAAVDAAISEKGSEAATQKADTANAEYFVDGGGIAIRGTDPVAYFTDGAPVEGSSEFSYTWGNATWQFASAENRDLFAANPEQYAPQYGGFCAWAVSQGYTASIDPEAWRIVDGRLYLNYDRRIQQRWEQDIPGHISQADANWPGVLEAS